MNQSMTRERRGYWLMARLMELRRDKQDRFLALDTAESAVVPGGA